MKGGGVGRDRDRDWSEWWRMWEGRYGIGTLR